MATLYKDIKKLINGQYDGDSKEIKVNDIANLCHTKFIPMLNQEVDLLVLWIKVEGYHVVSFEIISRDLESVISEIRFCIKSYLKEFSNMLCKNLKAGYR